ncbi:unnamed protein product, partial [Ascophyllum nodosum]
DLLTFGDCGRTSVAEFVGRMTKTTREDFAPPLSRASIPRRWMLHHLLHRGE